MIKTDLENLNLILKYILDLNKLLAESTVTDSQTSEAHQRQDGSKIVLRDLNFKTTYTANKHRERDRETLFSIGRG